MTEELAKFIKQNIKLIDESEFDNLYKKAHNEGVQLAELTQMLLESDVEFLSSMTKIPGKCFAGINSLKQIIIPDSVQSIGDFAFTNCTNLKHVELSSKLLDTGYSTFSGCGLNSIWIPKSLRVIGCGSFASCTDLTSLTFEERSKCNEIDDSAFEYCGKLKTVRLPESLEILGKYAFSSCESLEDITIGSNVKTIHTTTFYDCANLTTITILGNSAVFSGLMFETNPQLKTININISKNEFISRFGSKKWYQNLKQRNNVTINCVDGIIKWGKII